MLPFPSSFPTDLHFFFLRVKAKSLKGPFFSKLSFIPRSPNRLPPHEPSLTMLSILIPHRTFALYLKLSFRGCASSCLNIPRLGTVIALFTFFNAANLRLRHSFPSNRTPSRSPCCQHLPSSVLLYSPPICYVYYWLFVFFY